MLSVFQALADWIYGIVVAVLTYLGDMATWVITEAVAFAFELLPPAIKEALASGAWAGVLSFFDDVTYFIPFYSSVAIIAGTLVAVSSIRLVRYILSLIPTWIIGDA